MTSIDATATRDDGCLAHVGKECLELCCGSKPSAIVQAFPEWEIDRPWDMTCLGIDGFALPGVSLMSPDIDDGAVLEFVESDDTVESIDRGVVGWPGLSVSLLQLKTPIRPRAKSSIEEPTRLMADRSEHPPHPCRHRSRHVVIDRNFITAFDTEPAQGLGEDVNTGEGMTSVTLWGGQVRVEIHEYRTRDMTVQVLRPSVVRIGERPTKVKDAYLVQARVQLVGLDEGVHWRSIRL